MWFYFLVFFGFFVLVVEVFEVGLVDVSCLLISFRAAFTIFMSNTLLKRLRSLMCSINTIMDQRNSGWVLCSIMCH